MMIRKFLWGATASICLACTTATAAPLAYDSFGGSVVDAHKWEFGGANSGALLLRQKTRNGGLDMRLVATSNSARILNESNYVIGNSLALPKEVSQTARALEARVQIRRARAQACSRGVPRKARSRFSLQGVWFKTTGSTPQELVSSIELVRDSSRRGSAVNIIANVRACGTAGCDETLDPIFTGSLGRALIGENVTLGVGWDPARQLVNFYQRRPGRNDVQIDYAYLNDNPGLDDVTVADSLSGMSTIVEPAKCDGTAQSEAVIDVNVREFRCSTNIDGSGRCEPDL